MISRYTNPEMGRIWSEQRRYDTWLLVEVAAAEAMAEAGLIPAAAARDIRECGAVDADRVSEIEAATQHDIIAFTTAVAEQVGESARWLHFGLTSSDVLDTAQAIQMREACGLILQGLDALADAVRARAEEHRATVMIGRTHGVHAEPMTFGLKLALWYAELTRHRSRLERARETVSVGKVSGAVGTYAHLDPAIEARVCERLGLQPAPVSSQVIQRDRHAELFSVLAILGASLEKFCAGNPGAAENRNRRGRRAVWEGPKRLVGYAAQAQPDRVRTDYRPGAPAASQCNGRNGECRTVARTRHLALVG